MPASDAFIGEIYMAGFNFAPRNFAFCNGQILSITQNTALFSLLGTTYGGNGQTTFALPDLRGRVPMHFGQGPGLSNRVQGEVSGTETVTLITNQLPSHIHSLNAVTDAGDTSVPTGALLGNTGALDKEYKGSGGTPTTMGATAIGATGGNQPHANMQPYLVLNFYICLSGIFPSRN